MGTSTTKKMTGNLLLFLAVSLIQLPHPLYADYQIEVQVVSYQNPSNDLFSGSNCDFGFFVTNQCDTHLEFCFRPPGYSSSTIGGLDCPLGTFVPGRVGDDDITFGDTVGSLSNPFIVSSSDTWLGSFQLLIEVYDDDGGSIFNPDDFIDQIFASPFNLTVGTSITRSYAGQRARIEFRFQVRCATNFYGETCSVFCVDTDTDTGGHFTCNPITGEKVCLPGFTNPALNCTTAVTDAPQPVSTTTVAMVTTTQEVTSEATTTLATDTTPTNATQTQTDATQTQTDATQTQTDATQTQTDATQTQTDATQTQTDATQTQTDATQTQTDATQTQTDATDQNEFTSQTDPAQSETTQANGGQMTTSFSPLLPDNIVSGSVGASQGKNERTLAAVVGVFGVIFGVAVLVLLIVLIVFVLWKRRRKTYDDELTVRMLDVQTGIEDGIPNASYNPMAMGVVYSSAKDAEERTFENPLYYPASTTYTDPTAAASSINNGNQNDGDTASQSSGVYSTIDNRSPSRAWALRPPIN